MGWLDVINELSSINIVFLEKLFRDLEVSGGVVGAPLIIRLDGVRFGSRLNGFASPRDECVHKALVEAGVSLLKWFSADFIHVVSDEINVYMLRRIPYGGRFFKLVSISSGIASAVTSIKLSRTLFFDSRIIKLSSLDDAIKYYKYRARISSGNLLTQLCKGLGCEHESYMTKAKILSKECMNIEEWMLIGTCIYTEEYTKTAINKRTGGEVKVKRRKIAKISKFKDCAARLQNIINQIKVDHT